MNEHDSLCSHALNNMTLNELAHTYADLKLENKRLRDVLEWYANTNNYFCDFGVGFDRGERARKALERGEG